MESSLPGGPYTLNVLGMMLVFEGSVEHVAREYSEVKGEECLIASLYGSLGGVSVCVSLGGGVSMGVFMSLGGGVSMGDSLEVSPHVFTTGCVIDWRKNSKNVAIIIKNKKPLTIC